jgi:ribonuclease HII
MTPAGQAPRRGEKGRAAPSRWSPIERKLRDEHGPLIAGIDEVGRGPLAGPVVACAIVMPPGERAIAGVDDSKQLLRPERERLAVIIRRRAVAIGIGAASVREIDRLNIYHATVLAMRRAIARLRLQPNHVLIDGNPVRTLGVEHTAIVGGDSRCYTIACASIIAKVTRDRVMRALGLRHPDFAWETNVGYATRAHITGLIGKGPTAHHRRSFIPVQQLSLDFGNRTADSDIDAVIASSETLQRALDEAAIPAEPLEPGSSNGLVS